MNKRITLSVIGLSCIALLGASCFTKSEIQTTTTTSPSVETKNEPVEQELKEESTIPVQQDEVLPKTSESNDKSAMESTDSPIEEEPKSEPPAETKPLPISYTGAKLSGGNSPVIAFNQSDYEKALAAGKTVVITFYANWCPTCKKQEAEFLQAMQAVNNDNVVGFRANYKDSDTDSFEEDLARAHGITVQHSKVILRGSERLVKSPAFWSKDQYLSEINSIL